MRINRIYIETRLQAGTEVTLVDSAANHVIRVLRLKSGAPLELFNGDNRACSATITGMDRRSVRVHIRECHQVSRESPFSVHLWQGISRGDKMDLVIQKAVELGVAEITPVFTERCGVRLPPDRLQKKLDHWRKVVISACEQCGRNLLPILHDAEYFSGLLARQPFPASLVLDPKAGQALSGYPIGTDGISLVVGPEGGLTEQEIGALIEAGAQGVTLGPRILRTETAPLVAISLLQAKYGDLGQGA